MTFKDWWNDDSFRLAFSVAFYTIRTDPPMAATSWKAYVRPTLEVVLVESPEYLCRRVDEETGLALIRL